MTDKPALGLAPSVIVLYFLLLGLGVYGFYNQDKFNEDQNNLFERQDDTNRRVTQNTRRLDRRSKQNRAKVTRLNRVVLGSPGKSGIAGQSIRGPRGVGGLSVTGPGGPTGTGLPGAQGLAGAPGVSGRDGAAGSSGTAGKDGKDGAVGSSGAQGPQGEQGDTGAQGATGPEPDLTGRTLTCSPTADPLDPPTTQTCTFDP